MDKDLKSLQSHSKHENEKDKHETGKSKAIMDKDLKSLQSHSKHEKEKDKHETEKSKASVPSPPPPLTDACFTGCNKHLNPCCQPVLKPTDPLYMTSPVVDSECKNRTPVEPYESEIRKRAYMKDLLVEEAEEQRLHPIEDNVERKNSILEMREHYENNPKTTRSLDFLKEHPEFQIAGANPMRVPHDELIKAMDGFSNMQLAHEICINHDFRLERVKAKENSMEERVRTIMRKAYWDTFDEALTAKTPNHKQAIGVFREMKEMLLNLLLPHNRGMRERIEFGLNEERILEEIGHDILDFHKYSNFIIETLGQLCCPMRDRQIFALKSLQRPSDLFREILEVMEQMQMDMANFLIGQFRPTIISNCVEYERLKFAQFIDLEYRLHEDAIRVTRSWLLRHRIGSRNVEEVIGQAFAEVLLWKEKEWPETLTLDWVRFVAMAEETRRISYLGSVVLGVYNLARPMLLEDDDNISQLERDNNVLLRSYKVRDILRESANILLTKEDTVDEKTAKEALERVAEQAVKICDDCMMEMHNKHLSEADKDTLRRVVRDVGREDYQIRPLLMRRMQEYISERIATGGKTQVEFPKALLCMQEESLTVCVELHRIAMHNRGVFDDLYRAIIENEVSPPVFMKQNDGKPDPMVQKTVDILRTEASRKLVVTRYAHNEKLESTLDEKGNHIPQIEDGPVVETTPEIEEMIDKIIAETTFVDDYDEYANISEKAAVAQLHKLNQHDSATILRQMQKEEEAINRIIEKKRVMRVKLRETLKLELGLPLFHKVLNKESDIHTYCKLLKVMAQEEADKRANAAAKTEESSIKSDTENPKGGKP